MTSPKAPPMTDEPENRALIEKADKALLRMNDGPDRELVLDLVAALEAQLAAAPRAGVVENTPWPLGVFRVLDPDTSDEHGPIYLVCPGGLMVNFSNDPTPGLDEKRVQWIADVLNAPPAVPDPHAELVAAAYAYRAASKKYDKSLGKSDSAISRLGVHVNDARIELLGAAERLPTEHMTAKEG